MRAASAARPPTAALSSGARRGGGTLPKPLLGAFLRLCNAPLWKGHLLWAEVPVRRQAGLSPAEVSSHIVRQLVQCAEGALGERADAAVRVPPGGCLHSPFLHVATSKGVAAA